MEDRFDIVFVTHLPVFYKINLFNSINNYKKILVIFVAQDTNIQRSDDFCSLDNAKFPFVVLSPDKLEKRNIFLNFKKLISTLSKINFEHIVVSGWELLEFWLVILKGSKKKNAMILESTVHESKSTGIKGFIKRLFLSRISKVFASGSLHSRLMGQLEFKGGIFITKGVGIIRRPPTILKKDCSIKNRVIYVGRLSEEKNLLRLIDVFIEVPDLYLDIYGSGPLEANLKKRAKSNVVFHGNIPNKNLGKAFEKADFLILPSEIEPWGLVVEEALYHGLEVLVSDRCGVIEILDDLSIYSFDSDLKKVLLDYHARICLNSETSNLKKSFLKEKDEIQIRAYTENL